MRRELDDRLPWLEPKPAGYARLRARIARARETRARWWHVLVPAASVAAVAMALVISRPAEHVRFDANPALLRFGLSEAPKDAVSGVPAAPVMASSEVTFYWVESAAAE